MESLKEMDLINPEKNFRGISKEEFDELKNQVSFGDEDIELSDEFKKETVLRILKKLNWNRIYELYERAEWAPPQGFNHEMGE
ncbi:MAG: hypothetical protein ACOC1O_00575 [bacterium]